MFSSFPTLAYGFWKFDYHSTNFFFAAKFGWPVEYCPNTCIWVMGLCYAVMKVFAMIPHQTRTPAAFKHPSQACLMSGIQRLFSPLVKPTSYGLGYSSPILANGKQIFDEH
jgi:hypothetical protein